MRLICFFAGSVSARATGTQDGAPGRPHVGIGDVAQPIGRMPAELVRRRGVKHRTFPTRGRIGQIAGPSRVLEPNFPDHRSAKAAPGHQSASGRRRTFPTPVASRNFSRINDLPDLSAELSRPILSILGLYLPSLLWVAKVRRRVGKVRPSQPLAEPRMVATVLRGGDAQAAGPVRGHRG